MLKINIPNVGNPLHSSELTAEIAITVKIYAISFMFKFLVLNLRIVKMANKPIAIPNWAIAEVNTIGSIEPIMKITIPIRK
jgi:hypothetical protein